MIVAYYYNTWNDSQIHIQIEEVSDGCDFVEIHDALAAYLALKGISVHEWAIEVLGDYQLKNETYEEMIKRGERLIREEND